MMDSLGNTMSETGSAGSAEEEISLEELVLSTMEKQGLLAEMKARIMLFVQENGKMDAGMHVTPSRANQKILQYIFEYLEWVGMRNTSSLLISESPVLIDASLNTHTVPPRICKLFENVEKEDNASKASKDDEKLSDISVSTPAENKNCTAAESKDLNSNPLASRVNQWNLNLDEDHVSKLSKYDEKLSDMSMSTTAENSTVDGSVDSDSNTLKSCIDSRNLPSMEINVSELSIDEEKLSNISMSTTAKNSTADETVDLVSNPLMSCIATQDPVEANNSNLPKAKDDKLSEPDIPIPTLAKSNTPDETFDLDLDSNPLLSGVNAANLDSEEDNALNFPKDEEKLPDISVSTSARNSTACETIDVGLGSNPLISCLNAVNLKPEEDKASKLSKDDETLPDISMPTTTEKSTLDDHVDLHLNSLISCMGGLILNPEEGNNASKLSKAKDETLSDISMSTTAENSTADDLTELDSNSLISCDYHQSL